MNKPIFVGRDSTIGSVLKKILKEKKSRFLIESETPQIVTEKDISMFLLSDDSERKLDNIPIMEISKQLITVDKQTSPSESSKEMISKGIGSLGVTSEQSIVGIITKTDLTKYYSRNFEGKKVVGEYMSPFYSFQYQDTTLDKIVKKMIDEKISRVILRDYKENPVGIITFRDLFRLSLEQGKHSDVLDNSDPAISVVFSRKGFLSESGFGATTKAHDVMSKNIVSVNYDQDLAKTASLLLEKNINGAGVLSGNGNLIGIISKTDIVKALAYS